MYIHVFQHLSAGEINALIEAFQDRVLSYSKSQGTAEVEFLDEAEYHEYECRPLSDSSH